MSTKRVINKPVTLAVEGSTENAFASHLKNLKGRGTSNRVVNIYPAGGGAGTVVMDKAIIYLSSENYAWMDFDRLQRDSEEYEKVKRQARENGIQVNFSKPKVEVFLLEILEISIRSNSDLDKLLNPQLGKQGKTVRQSYEKSFGIDVLQNRRSNVPLLDWLMNIFEL